MMVQLYPSNTFFNMDAAVRSYNSIWLMSDPNTWSNVKVWPLNTMLY